MAWLHTLESLLIVLLLPPAVSLVSTATSAWSNDGGGPKPAISADASKQIGAVLDTLKDIVSTIDSERVTEAANYQAYMCWCQDEQKRLYDILVDAQDVNEESDLRSKELNSTIEHSQEALNDLAKSIQEAKDVIAKAETLRKKESSQYDSDMQLNRESLGQVNKAIKIVGKVHGQGGFLQHGALQRVRLNEPGESSYVLGIMKGLKEKLEKTRHELEEEEKGKVTMHDSFLQAKQAALSSFNDESISKKSLLTESRIKLLQAQKTYKQSAEQIAQTSEVLKEVQARCHTKFVEYSVREKDRTNEKAALQEAIEAVKKTAEDASSGQGTEEDADYPAVKNTAEDAEEDADDPTPAPSFLQMRAAARQQESQGAADSASDADLDMDKEDYAGAKAAVKKLMAVLVKEQKEEDEKYRYCKAELDKKGKEEASITGEASELTATANLKTTEIASLGQQVEKLSEEVEKLENGRKNAWDLRKKEREDHEAGSRDRKLSVKVLHQAIKVLEKFYATTDKTALLQTTKAAQLPTPPPTWSRSSRKDLHSSIVVQMIDKVADEILEAEETAAKEEAAAEAQFKKFYADSLAEIDKVNAEITECMKSKAKLGVQLNSDKEAEAAKKADLTTVKAQLVSLHEECDDLLKMYEQRTKARKFEMDQLKDVHEILSGSKIAARTGLLQSVAAALAGDGPEAALLRELSVDGSSTSGD